MPSGNGFGGGAKSSSSRGSGFGSGRASSSSRGGGFGAAGKGKAEPSEAPEEPRKSFLSNLVTDAKHTVTNVPRGLVEVAKGAGTELAEITKSAVVPGYVGRQRRERASLSPAEQHAYDLKHAPISFGWLDSNKRTAGRLGSLAALAPGGQAAGDAAIVRDYREHPVASLVEDAANIAPVLKGLGVTSEQVAARTASPTAGRVARATNKAAEATQAVAAAPAKPFELAGRVGGKAAKAGYLKAAESEGVAGNLLRRAKLDPDSRAASRVLHEGQEQVSEATGRQVALGQKLERILPGKDEQAAMFAVGEGEAAALAKLRAHLPADEFERFVADRYGDSLSAKAAHLAADVADGKAPELADRIDEALKVGRTEPGGRLDRLDAYLEPGKGRDFQTGFDADPVMLHEATVKAMKPLPRAERLAANLRARADEAAAKLDDVRADLSAAVEQRGKPIYGEGKRLGILETRARDLEKRAAAAEKRLGTLRANVPKATAKAAISVEAAPARLRPALAVNRAAVKELETHAEALRTAGDHAGADLVERAAQELPVTRRGLAASGVDVDHFIHIRVGDKPIGGGGQEVALPKVRKTRAEKQRTGSAQFDRTFRAQAQAEIDELRGGIARETAKKIESLPFAKRFRTPAEAAEAGYVAWDPKNIFEKNPNPKPGAVYVPEHVFENFRSYFNDPRWDRTLAATYDRALRAWKVSVLPLSPSWQIGNIVGNATLATLGAGIGPVRLAKAMNEAIREYRASGPKGERQLPGPRRLYTSGATHAEFDFLRGVDAPTSSTGLGRAAQRVAHPAQSLIHGSYALNSFVDDFGRSAVFIAKKGEGLSDEAALRESLKAMGDFSKMSPFERRVVKRIVPFYSWQRHMTQLAFRLPVEHPMRVAWTLHIADQYGQPEEGLDGLPDYQRGAIPLPGGRLLGTNSFFPFGDAGKILTPEGLRQSLSPLIKVPAEHFTGLNFFSGRPFTRPPGTGKVDDFGREVPTAPPLMKHLTDQIPQKRLWDAFTGRSSVVRYDSGDRVITADGPIPSDKTFGRAGLRYLGIPITDRKVAEEQAKRAEEAKAKLRKAKKNYDKRRANAGA